MRPDDDGWGSAARAVWNELLDRKLFRIVGFLVGLALVWWLRSR